jgi:hypothetical protein
VLVLALVDGVGNAMLPLVDGVDGNCWLVSSAHLSLSFIGEMREEVTPPGTGDWYSDGKAMAGFDVLSEVGVSIGLVSTNFEVDSDSMACSGDFSESLKNFCIKTKTEIELCISHRFGKITHQSLR